MKTHLVNRSLGVMVALIILASTWWGFAQTDTKPDPVQDLPIKVEQTTDEKPEGTIDRHQIVIFGQNVVLNANETSREVVVMSGDATINGVVRHNVVVVGGDAKIDGTVKGDLVVVLGSATLGPKAEVKGETVVVGGVLKADPGAKTHGTRTEVSLESALPTLRGLADWMKGGLLLARPLPPQVAWVWIVAGIFFLINLLMATLFPHPAQVCLDTLEKQPVGSFFTGVLVFVLFGPLVVLLAISVVGILIIPFLFCALIAAALFGKLVVYRYTGHQLGGQFGLAAIQLPLVALVVGTGIFYLLYMVPILGFVVWGVATLLGMGAVLLAAAGSFRREGEKANPVPDFANPRTSLSVSSAGSGQAPPALNDVISYPRAGFWIRFVSALLDFVLVAVLSAMTHFPPTIILFLPVYYIMMWTWKGTSIGGIVMGIKVVRTDGQPVDFAVALVRSLSSFFSGLVFFLGFFWAGWDREKQSWHDKISGTVVVRVPRGVSLV